MFELNGKTALVTGASGGIGGAIAKALVRQGARVALSGTRTLANQRLGDCAADATRSAGHQRGLSVEFEHGASLLKRS